MLTGLYADQPICRPAYMLHGIRELARHAHAVWIDPKPCVSPLFCTCSSAPARLPQFHRQ